MSGKKESSGDTTRPQTQFFAASELISATRALTLSTSVAHTNAPTDDGVSIRDVLRSKLLENQKDKDDSIMANERDGEWNSTQFVQLDRETSDHVKSLIQQSDAIRRVRKERIFEDEVTEEEMAIIQQRVALQQKQFAEFERKEFAHKAGRIKQMYSYLDDEEIREALKEGQNDVDETIYQFSTPGYLLKLRKTIALKYTPLTATPQMTDDQRIKYEEMLKKRTRVQKKTTTSDDRDKYRTVGRLPLDEALAQLQRAATAKNGSGIDLSKAMKGWSEARIKAFKAIKTKPNTYYYRFNAPGEEQRTGQWTEEEQRLFHARLKEIGANGQWGIFSMTIPGRVGYQCSNYYRYLVENRLIHDPNYVLDDKGKAHYLFTTKKKNPDGTAMRVFRKHKKPHVRMSREKYGYSSSDSDDGGEGGGGGSSSSNRQPKGALTTAMEEAAAVAVATVGTPGSSAESADGSNSNVAAMTSSSNTRTTRSSAPRHASNAIRKRKRRNIRYDDGDSDDDVIRANEVELSDDNEIGEDSSDGEYRASASRTSRARSSRTSRIDANGHNSSAVEMTPTIIGGASDGNNSETEHNLSDTEIDPNNPLPDLLDPITLEPVSKPAISPYGHVMGYNSWVRCLMFPPEGSQRNVCPLTKKPLSKRDLVVLTHDNIDQYRAKIVNI